MPLGKPLEPSIQNALEQACIQAERYLGATSPNPPVGAAALDAEGRILNVSAHEKAGEPHAEARVLSDLAKHGLLERAHTLVVTLEPCNHFGRTPPCSEALLKIPALKRLFFAVSDPHPRAQGGAARLSQNGIVGVNLGELASENPVVERAQRLTRPFFHWVQTHRPWVTVKTAWREVDGKLSMLPPPREKTFTSPTSLRFAHELRKRADAIITGSGTVLADWPEFTVRHVADHVGKKRWLAIMDRRGRVPEEWIGKKREQGFEVFRAHERTPDFRSLLEFLGDQGVLEVLVEAGPALSEYVLSSGQWNESIRIIKDAPDKDAPDTIERKLADVHRNH